MSDLITALFWLIINVYHEARSEDPFYQMAVAHVTLNRARISHTPIKEVVNQPYQFTWTLTKRPIPDDWGAFIVCAKSSIAAVKGYDFTQGATHYHRIDVHPAWADSGIFVAQFGVHKFYKEVP